MDVARIWVSEKQLHALTGVTKSCAYDILKDFEEGLKEIGYLKEKGVGRRQRLDSKGILLMLLMYYKHYDSLESLGALFNLNVSNVKRWIDISEKILKQVLFKKKLFQLTHQNQEKKL
jgi:Helix-turn-helix of DDE superfamily endonuclease